jgi:predicted DNA binding CopG/RHH family protein
MEEKVSQRKNELTDDKNEEKKLIELLEKGIPKVSAERKKELVAAAEKTISRTKPVSIRLQVKDLNAIQKKAVEVGVPYQTLINLLIRQYIQGKIKLTL